jgi:uncharacterized ubiquitin-like protein YukD
MISSLSPVNHDKCNYIVNKKNIRIPNGCPFKMIITINISVKKIKINIIYRRFYTTTRKEHLTG